MALEGQVFALPLPPGARCTIRHGALVFHIRRVPAARVSVGRRPIDRPLWLSMAASVVLCGGLLALSSAVLPAEDALSLDDGTAANRFAGYMNRPQAPVLETAPPIESEPSLEDVGPRPGAALARRKAGAKAASSRRAGPGREHLGAAMARGFDPDRMARTAGILALIEQQGGDVIASPYGDAFARDTDDDDIWAQRVGVHEEAFGVGGLHLIELGGGGGGTGEGTIGLGDVGLLGARKKGGGGGCGCGYGKGSGAGFGRRPTVRVSVRAAEATVRGALDKGIIRRVVRAHLNEVRHCYNQGLVRDPMLAGRVAVQFTIAATGNVPAAVVGPETTIGDRSVAQCVAQAVRRWTFPRPVGGGSVVVTYPFVLQPGT
jgi:hypothetical protein